MNRFTDSFSHYSTLAQLDAKWQGGRTGGTVNVGATYALGVASQGLQCSAGGTSFFVPVYAHYFLGIRTKLISGSVFQDFINFFDGSSSTQCSIQRDSGGTISLRRSGTTLATSTLTLALNQKYYIEVEVIANTSSGLLTVWVDGVQYITFSGNTSYSAANSISKIQLSAGGGGGNVIYYSDCYCNDNTGSVCNSRQGDTSIQCLTVSAAGTYAQFSRGGTDTGTNYGQLAKALADATSYNVSNVLNQRDSFTMAALASGTILGARLWAYAQKDNVGSRSIALTVESSDTDDIGSNLSLGGGAYSFYSRDMSLNPNTSALWASVAALNASKSGYTITV